MNFIGLSEKMLQITGSRALGSVEYGCSSCSKFPLIIFHSSLYRNCNNTVPADFHAVLLQSISATGGLPHTLLAFTDKFRNNLPGYGFIP